MINNKKERDSFIKRIKKGEIVKGFVLPEFAKSDLEIMILLIKENIYFSKFATDELKNNEIYAQEVLNISPSGLHLVGEKFSYDKNIVLKAVKWKPSQYMDLKNYLIYDKEIILAATECKENISAIPQVALTKEIVLKLFDLKYIPISEKKENTCRYIYYSLSSFWKKDRDIAEYSVSQCSCAYNFLDASFKNDIDIALLALTVWKSERGKRSIPEISEDLCKEKTFRDFVSNGFKRFLEKYQHKDLIEKYNREYELSLKFKEQNLKKENTGRLKAKI